jgi:hypothetical protein
MTQTYFGINNSITFVSSMCMDNRQFQLLVYACGEGWEVGYHIADYAEKMKLVAV